MDIIDAVQGRVHALGSDPTRDELWIIVKLGVPQLVAALKASARREAALAAHVEQANRQVDAYRKVEGSPLYLASRLGKWRDEAPETSLAKLINESQAEFLEEMAILSEQDGEQWTIKSLRKEAQHLRRQANQALSAANDNQSQAAQ